MATNNNMTVSSALDQLAANIQMSKQAAAAPAPASQPASTGLAAVTLAAQQLQKLASEAPANSPAQSASYAQPGANNGNHVADLQKLASAIADVDQAAAIQQSRLLGAAAFDGMLARANEFSKVASEQQKVAAYQQHQAQQMARHQQAQQMAYLEQQKLAAYQAQAQGAIHGYQAADALIQAQEMSKIASAEEAWLSELSSALVEIGATCKVAFDTGYAHAHAVLSNIGNG